ncbi:hypothetical protein FB567DRAFT_431805 [Paraphoma chrysanthemicola]|uniref:Uncharacterized protein n=1 Tax=Paraphoma chrysanthemicola TaxID=798071 RepID=A0A8K0RJE7_9PLEO|nr:hypothetical protein FB567DRAFT_431805 [Paraphoma chrysanthemicola]
MITLASGNASSSDIESVKVATEVFYDPSQPVRVMGLPIYIRHPSSLRPATANAVCVQNRIFLQTVYHAFSDEAYESETTTNAADGDLEILSDTESETDDDDDVDQNPLYETNSDASDRVEGLKWLSCPNSPQRGHSRRSTFSCDASTSPPTIASPKHHPYEALINEEFTSGNDDTTGSKDRKGGSTLFAPVGRVYRPISLEQSAPPPLESLGKLLKSSALNDWALIEITSPIVRETLNLLLKNDLSQLLAYDKIARSPDDGTEIYTCTASGGKTYGMLSSAPSFTRFSNTTSFQEVYVVRLDGTLATGDCGSAIIDCTTGDTYGHLVAGCKATGTAYAVTAYQTALGLSQVRPRLTSQGDVVQSQCSRQQSPEMTNGPILSNATERQLEAELDTTPSSSLRQGKNLVETNNQGSSWFTSSFIKRWPKEFCTTRKPNNEQPYLVHICNALDTKAMDNHAKLFMQTDDDDVPSCDAQFAIKFMQNVPSNSLYSQRRFSKKRATAWLHDETYGQSLAGRLSSTVFPYSHSEPRGSQGISPDCSRLPRTYSARLTAHELYCHLREKQFNHETLLDADRRLIHIADPDAYDLLALVRTATHLQRESLRDAICAYLALRTSIKAAISQQGYRMFRLEFHISYFALRRSQPTYPALCKSGPATRSHRSWTNIDFLNHDDTYQEGEQEVLSLLQAQISVTVCGSSHSCWNAYCFEDRYFNQDDDNMDSGEEEEMQIEKILRTVRHRKDPTIWDPREYFLRVLLNRIQQVKREWEELVRHIETSSREWFATRDSLLSKGSYAVNSAFYDDILELLGKSRHEISATNDAWAQFTSGDFGLFEDTASSPRMTETIHQLNDVFASMLCLQKRVQHLVEECDKRAQAVQLQTITDSTKKTELIVYYSTPFILVSVIFALPEFPIHFERSLLSFFTLVILCLPTVHILVLFWRGTLRIRKNWRMISKRLTLTWNVNVFSFSPKHIWRRLSRRVRAAGDRDAAMTATDGATIDYCYSELQMQDLPSRDH